MHLLGQLVYKLLQLRYTVRSQSVLKKLSLRYSKSSSTCKSLCVEERGHRRQEGSGQNGKHWKKYQSAKASK